MRIVARCLRKAPDERFQSAADLAFALQSLSDPGAPVVPAAPAAIGRRPWRVLGILAAAALATTGYLLATGLRQGDPPVFEQLSVQRGAVHSTRAAPDGVTLVYSGAFDGGPAEVYLGRTGSPGSRSTECAAGFDLRTSPAATRPA